MLTRLWIGLFLSLIGFLSMLIIDLAGHLHSVNDQGIGSLCMFTYTMIERTLLYPSRLRRECTRGTYVCLCIIHCAFVVLSCNCCPADEGPRGRNVVVFIECNLLL